MVLTAILLALWWERHLGVLEQWRRFGWFVAYCQRLHRHHFSAPFWHGTPALLLTLLPPILAIMVADNLLADLWGGWGFLFGILVLVYCFGPRDLEGELSALRHARDVGDYERAGWHTADLLQGPVPSVPGNRIRALLEAVFTAVFGRLVGVVFWFLVLGPAGALLHRLSWVVRQSCLQGESDPAFVAATRRLCHLLDWLPVRLCALSFAFAGSFVEARRAWRWARGHDDSNRATLHATGLGAMGFTPEQERQAVEEDVDHWLREAGGQIRRTELVWLAALGILTLAGWLP